jgi:hypothetical protein
MLALPGMARAQEAAAAPAAPERQVNNEEYLVRGNTVLDARAIEAAVTPFLGPGRTLKDVEGARDALVAAYQARGYQSVYVDLPEQQVEQGVVVLQVSEGDQRRSPVEALQAILGGLNPAEREQVKHSLFLGVARSDFSLEHSGEQPPAFLVRNLIGVDPRNGAVAVGERMRVGQKVQFQLRDADASREESRQLLRRQAGELDQQPRPLASRSCQHIGGH